MFGFVLEPALKTDESIPIFYFPSRDVAVTIQPGDELFYDIARETFRVARGAMRLNCVFKRERGTDWRPEEPADKWPQTATKIAAKLGFRAVYRATNGKEHWWRLER